MMTSSLCVALVVLVSVCVLADAASYNAKSYKRTSNRCYHPIPGTFKLMLGVDITKLDIFTRDGEDGFTRPLFEFSCAETIKLHGKSYQRPHPVNYYRPKDRGSFKPHTEVYSTPKDARTAFAADVGVTGTYGDFGFSDSNGFMKMQEAIMKDSKFISDVSAKDFATEVQMSEAKYLRIMSHAFQYFKNLKGDYESNPEPYKALVRMYGTHYYSKATLGGLVRTLEKTDASYVMDHNDLDMRTQSVALFSSKTSNISKLEDQDIHTDSAFMQHTITETEVYGGDRKLLQKGGKEGMEGWQNSVNENPYILSGVLRPLSDLAPFLLDDVKRDALNDAIRTYIINSYLDNLLVQVQTMESTEYLPPLTKKELLELDNVRKGIKEIKSNDPIEEKDEYFARKVGTIFENILRKHVVVPGPAPYQASTWREALDDAIRTQVTKAKLNVMLQTINDMTTEDYLPPVHKEEVDMLKHIQEDTHALLANEVFKDNDVETAADFEEKVHNIAKAHILIGQSGESGTWRDHLDKQVHKQIEYQSKAFDDKIKEVSKISRKYVAPPEPKHSGSWQIAAYVTDDKDAKSSGKVYVAIYGTKGWSSELLLNDGKKFSSGAVLRGDFQTPDVGRPLKLEVWLSNKDGTRLSKIELVNGDNSYTLGVHRWLDNKQMDRQTRMELEFP